MKKYKVTVDGIVFEGNNAKELTKLVLEYIARKTGENPTYLKG